MTTQDFFNGPLCILHLEDSYLDHALVKRELSKSNPTVVLERVETLAAFEQALDNSGFNIVLPDYYLPGFTAMDAWELMLKKKVRLPFILLSGAIGEPAAVAAIKVGVSDYLSKDDLSKLQHVIERSIEVHLARQAKEVADIELALSEKRLASFADHLQNTIEQERASIAREIHDDIGGSLAAIRFDLAWVERHTTDQATLAHVQSATEMVQLAIGASQRIMMNLRPAILDQGLAAAIQWLAGSFSKRTGIESTVSVRQALSPLITKAIQLVAYRTAQEALTNIGKYAKCDRVAIDITDAEGFLTLEVNDNGQGIAAEDLTKPQSFGIRGLKERAKTVDGWVDVSSHPKSGTSIILSVPLTQLAES